LLLSEAQNKHTHSDKGKIDNNSKLHFKDWQMEENQTECYL
jgi:hypothetical protein